MMMMTPMLRLPRAGRRNGAAAVDGGGGGWGASRPVEEVTWPHGRFLIVDKNGEQRRGRDAYTF